MVSYKYTESDLRNAAAEVLGGAPVRTAARLHGVPPSTLRDRLNGRLPKAVAQTSRARLSLVQEQRLTGWILLQAALGCPPTHHQVRVMAQGICVARGDFDSIGKRWTERFIRRNPVLKTVKNKGVDSIRVSNATEEVIRPWFDRLRLPGVTAIAPANRWNMDETGIANGLGTNGLVLGHREHRSLQRKAPGSRTWTLIIECISASGRSLSPLVIFKGMSV